MLKKIIVDHKSKLKKRLTAASGFNQAKLIKAVKGLDDLLGKILVVRQLKLLSKKSADIVC